MLPTVIDLFCGAGGLAFGFRKAGFPVGLSVDHNAAAVATARANGHKNTLKLDLFKPPDLARVKAEIDAIPKPVMVIGGPPCQGFSLRNNTRLKTGIVQDDRNTLFETFCQLIAYANPEVFLFENVPGIMAGNSHFFPAIEEALRIGDRYRLHSVRPGTVSLFGVPASYRDYIVRFDRHGLGTIRNRVFVVGVRADIDRQPHTLALSPGKTFRQITADLPPIPMGQSTADPLHHTTMRILPAELALGQWGVRFYARTGRSGMRVSLPEIPRELWQPRWRRTGKRTHPIPYIYRPDRPTQAITADYYPLQELHYCPDQCRFITLRERARAQSFPDTYQFHGSFRQIAKQIGNAVPPQGAYQIAMAIRQGVYARAYLQ